MAENSERIIRTDYSEIMQKNYIDYAMSVIVSRALPDVRDGLKPVQRRVLYDMYELGVRYDRPYRKSARIVGDTMGKYHPHGDSSIYDSLVVMAQDFKKGQVLVDGHGNFGSIEGDGAAAMRYTEARLAKITQEVFLADLDKEVVDFIPNFDETEKEPSVLPVRIPNILINGSEGIAVGMATSIPPHNLGETIDALKAYIRNPEASEEELFSYVKGPDFPTGGIVVNKDELPEIYRTGQGKIRIRGRVTVEKLKGGKQQIVVTELPYTMIGAGIGKFMSDAAALAESRATNAIADISNQSSKEGTRIVIELKKGADPEEVINLLYKKTRLEDTFGVNMLVVSDGRPETMPLKRILEAFTDYRFSVASRLYRNLLERDLEKSEVEDGLIRACDVIDLIIEILRGSKSAAQAKKCLVMGETAGIKFRSKKSEKEASQLSFTERQAEAILQMRLVKLIGLEIDALIARHAETLERIARYEKLLSDYDALAGDIIGDLDRIKAEYARARRTSIVNAEAVVIKEKPEEAEEVVFTMDRFGYAKLLDVSAYDKNKETADSEYKTIFKMMSDDKVCVFTDTGKLHTAKGKDIPRKRLKDKGVPIDNICNYTGSTEEIVFVAPAAFVKEHLLFFASSDGLVKCIEGEQLISTTRTVAATKLAEGSKVAFVGCADAADYCVLMTKDGYMTRFALSEVPVQKKTAAGVRGIKLGEGDEVDACYLAVSGREFTAQWHGKSVSLNRLKLAKRGGSGTKSR